MHHFRSENRNGCWALYAVEFPWDVFYCWCYTIVVVAFALCASPVVCMSTVVLAPTCISEWGFSLRWFTFTRAFDHTVELCHDPIQRLMHNTAHVGTQIKHPRCMCACVNIHVHAQSTCNQGIDYNSPEAVCRCRCLCSHRDTLLQSIEWINLYMYSWDK